MRPKKKNHKTQNTKGIKGKLEVIDKQQSQNHRDTDVSLKHLLVE